MLSLADELKFFLKGNVFFDDETLTRFSRDTSLFEVRPEVVVAPRDVADLKHLIRFAREARERNSQQHISLTARSAGTDMTGGPLTESVVIDFMRHFIRIKDIGTLLNGDGYAVVEPGVFYRDFERETLKRGYFLPSYPASREICAVGGMVANNSGGEKTLKYGKTADYVMKLKVVLSDGGEYELRPLTQSELDMKMSLTTFEGEFYRKLYHVLDFHDAMIKSAKPAVSKNSAGYALWDVWNREKGIFDLTRLFVGSQGTLGMVTEITFRLVKAKPYSGLGVIFMRDLKDLGHLVADLLPLYPTSFEALDDHTFRLAMRFFTSFLEKLGAKNVFSLAWQFIPEFWLMFTSGVPKLVLLVEFEEETQQAVDEKLAALARVSEGYEVGVRYVHTREGAQKYWLMRRESFNLLRQKIKDKKTAPFIDDVIVRPEFLPEFLPRLYTILDKYSLLYTIAGHAGDGNFHVIPLMNLSDSAERKKIPACADEVYKLVLEYHGSITAEHNDGLIRSPYLKQMYGEKVYQLFEETKKIFDPLNIFNPGKKIGGSLEYTLSHIKKE